MRQGIAFVIIGLGALIVLASGFYFVQIFQGLSQRERHTGVVVASDRDLPDVEFTEQTGTAHRAHLDSGGKGQFQLGQQIDFYLDAQDSEWATPDAVMNLFPIQVIGAIFGFLLVLVGVLVWKNDFYLLGITFFGLGTLSILALGTVLLKDAISLQLTGTPLTGWVDKVSDTSRSEVREVNGKTRLVEVRQRTYTITYSAPDGGQRSFQVTNPGTKLEVKSAVPVVVDLSRGVPLEALRGWSDTLLSLLIFTTVILGFGGITVLLWVSRQKFQSGP